MTEHCNAIGLSSCFAVIDDECNCLITKQHIYRGGNAQISMYYLLYIKIHQQHKLILMVSLFQGGKKKKKKVSFFKYELVMN